MLLPQDHVDSVLQAFRYARSSGTPEEARKAAELFVNVAQNQYQRTEIIDAFITQDVLLIEPVPHLLEIFINNEIKHGENEFHKLADYLNRLCRQTHVKHLEEHANCLHNLIHKWLYESTCCRDISFGTFEKHENALKRAMK